MTPCPLCGHSEAARLFVKDDVAYERCTGCGLPTRGGETGPPSYHDHRPQITQALPPLTRTRYEHLLGTLERYRSGGRLLDVGCGGGFLVETAQALGWEAEGTEVSRAAVDFGVSRGLRLHHGTLDDVEFAAGAFDVVLMMEVIEHVPDPVALLRQIHGLLRPGGVLHLTTPNWGSLSRRLIGSAWFPVTSDHLSYFAPGTMRRALREAGLDPVRIRSANIQPHEILGHWRRRRTPPGGGAAEPARGSFMRETMDLRERVESRPWLRAAKSVVNACLGATGTGDTLRATAVRR